MWVFLSYFTKIKIGTLPFWGALYESMTYKRFGTLGRVGRVYSSFY